MKLISPKHSKTVDCLISLASRLVFSRFFYLRGNLGNVKEKPTRKTCLSLEKKRLIPHIWIAEFF